MFHFRQRFKGRPKPKVGMNKLEAAYADKLKDMRAAGAVLWFGYEAVKLRLADKTFYTPDFAVLLADGTLEFHETKGFWEEDARIKIKVAAETFPAVFKAMQFTKKTGWTEEDFSGTEVFADSTADGAQTAGGHASDTAKEPGAAVNGQDCVPVAKENRKNTPRRKPRPVDFWGDKA